MTSSIPSLHQVSWDGPRWYWINSVSRSTLMDTCVCIHTNQSVAQSPIHEGKEHQSQSTKSGFWPRFVIQVTMQDFEILVISKWFSLMSLPGLKNSMFPNPWARSPERLLSPSYSSSHFQQSHWSEGAPREQIQEGRGGITLAVRGSTKKRPISDGGRTSRCSGQLDPSTDSM